MTTPDLYTLLLEGYAATKIQACTRTWLQQKRHRKQARAARNIQRVWRQPGWRLRQHAARRIQHVWRGRGQRRTFIALSRLLSVGQQAEPRVLLACINPMEAALLDCASGVHLRLRLSGDAWPPQLMYRVYVHGTIAGVAAFNSGAATPVHPGTCLNAWRAVRMGSPLSSMMQQWRAARARARTNKPDVTYPPLVPAQQQAARVRQARQQRMLQMYQRHHAGAPEMDEDMALADMLQWCSELNIADYFERWDSLACIDASDRAARPDAPLQDNT